MGIRFPSSFDSLGCLALLTESEREARLFVAKYDRAIVLWVNTAFHDLGILTEKNSNANITSESTLPIMSFANCQKYDEILDKSERESNNWFVEELRGYIIWTKEGNLHFGIIII